MTTSFPICQNKTLFDFLIKPYLNIQTLAVLANVSDAFRKYCIEDNNQLWFQFYCLLSVSSKKQHKKLLNKTKIFQIISSFKTNSKLKVINPVIEPSAMYYYRVIFCDVFTIPANAVKDMQSKIADEYNKMKVNLTHKQQCEYLFPDRPPRILKAIETCEENMKTSTRAIKAYNKKLHTLLISVEIKSNILNRESYNRSVLKKC